MSKNKISQVCELLPNEVYSDDDSVKYFEANLISQTVFAKGYTELVLDKDELIELEIFQILEIVNERKSGKPLAYILKSWPFRGLELFIDERVLIPRSETEIVVQRALEEIKDFGQIDVLDIGTGSGAIALSIAQEHEKSKVLGVDVSEKALEVANINKNLLNFDNFRVSFQISDLFSGLDKSKLGKFDLIVSNPPYIGEDEIINVDDSVLKHEPRTALFAGNNGFEIYEMILNESSKWLNARGVLVFEIAPRHVESMLYKTKGIADVSIEKDLTGRDRIAVVKYRA